MQGFCPRLWLASVVALCSELPSSALADRFRPIQGSSGSDSSHALTAWLLAMELHSVVSMESTSLSCLASCLEHSSQRLRSFAARRAAEEDKQKFIDDHDCFIFDCDGASVTTWSLPIYLHMGHCHIAALQVSFGEATPS